MHSCILVFWVAFSSESTKKIKLPCLLWINSPICCPLSSARAQERKCTTESDLQGIPNVLDCNLQQELIRIFLCPPPEVTQQCEISEVRWWIDPFRPCQPLWATGNPLSVSRGHCVIWGAKQHEVVSYSHLLTHSKTLWTKLICSQC